MCVPLSRSVRRCAAADHYPVDVQIFDVGGGGLQFSPASAISAPMKEKADSKERSKLGPIPAEAFDNDPPYDPDVDKSPGSLYEKINRQIDKRRSPTARMQPRRRP